MYHAQHDNQAYVQLSADLPAKSEVGEVQINLHTTKSAGLHRYFYDFYVK